MKKFDMTKSLMPDSKFFAVATEIIRWAFVAAGIGAFVGVIFLVMTVLLHGA